MSDNDRQTGRRLERMRGEIEAEAGDPQNWRKELANEENLEEVRAKKKFWMQICVDLEQPPEGPGKPGDI